MKCLVSNIHHLLSNLVLGTRAIAECWSAAFHWSIVTSHTLFFEGTSWWSAGLSWNGVDVVKVPGGDDQDTQGQIFKAKLCALVLK